jgi:O-antigen ligase
VHFLGLPIYATYGVNSLVPLFCIQAAIICASIYGSPKPIALLLAAGLACAVYLTIGSENRASQLSLVLLVVPICWILWHKLRWHRTVLIAIALCVAFILLVMRGMGEHRLMTSIQEAAESITGVGESDSQSPYQEAKKIDAISTGRITIWRYAFNEWRNHPIIGNGFSTFGRYSDVVPDNVRQNTTAHFYYLNALWKGGLIFVVPLMVLIGIAVWGAWASRGLGFAVERAFFACAVVMAFTFQSLVWDFLTLPSGGSLAWFLLGMMVSREPHQA